METEGVLKMDIIDFLSAHHAPSHPKFVITLYGIPVVTLKGINPSTSAMLPHMHLGPVNVQVGFLYDSSVFKLVTKYLSSAKCGKITEVTADVS